MTPGGKRRSDEDHLINSSTASMGGASSGSTSSSHHQMRLCSISQESPEQQQSSSPRQLSTFFGVVVPCCLSMFSVILFLRMGFIVGQAGLYQTMAMLLLAYCIIGLTVLSVCAISTNGAIEGGGAYYMISRSLGPEFGGAIGIMFFLANVAGTALYVFGMVEALTSYFGPDGLLLKGVMPDSPWYPFLYGTIILLLCFMICLVGAAIYAKTTFIIFVVVIVSIASVLISFFVTGPEKAACQNNGTFANYTGFSKKTWNENLKDQWTNDYTTLQAQNFVTVFAVLFNGCTGIMAGANMSGELKNPSKSIPQGTIAACVITFLVYFVFVLLITASTPRELLHCSYSFLLTINVWPPLVAIGVFFSSMSAALSCLIGASRILHQLAFDDIFGAFLRPVKWKTSSGNPIIAVTSTWFLVQLTLFIGGVSKVAPIVTIFFLFSYAAVDLSCLALEWASAPNFRPTFKYFSWHTAIMGFVTCVLMMFLIQPMYTSISFLVLVALVVVIHYRSPTSAWGYISQALIFHQVRKYMLMLDVRKEHVKFWRPQILLMVKNPRSCCQLIDFINSIKKSGLYVLGHVSVGHLADMKEDMLGRQHHHWLNFVDLIDVKAFVELTLSGSVREGTESLLRISGLGGMKPNTLVLGFYDNSPQRDTFKDMKLLNKNNSEQGFANQTFEEVPSVTSASDDTSAMTSLFFTVQNNEQGFRNDNFTSSQYVNIICDALKMNKNVCLARYFDQMDRLQMAVDKPYYIDVWPVNLLKPLLSPKYQHPSNIQHDGHMQDEKQSSFFDTTCIFIMQMACILNMSQIWKKFTQLRIYVVESDDKGPTEQEIQEFLRAVRIQADIQIIQFEGGKHLMDLPANNIPTSKRNAYLKSANEMIKSRLDRTAVSFLYLPSPPPVDHLSSTVQPTDYVDMLTTLSDGLGPTFFIHGVSHVISF